MQVQAITRFGAPDVFHPLDLPRPDVTPGHVLIRVAASSVNPIDCVIRQGAVPEFAPAFPAVLHGDVAGVIEAVGEGVQAFKPGDEVYACAGGVRGTGGALAEFMLADAALVALKPRALTWREAAALPLVGITAWEGLIDRARVQPGQTVLVHGAAGGVGHIAIQLAKWAGATVFATGSSAAKLALARELGADDAINYRRQSVAEYVGEYTGGTGFDVVFDTVGGANFEQSLAAVALNGTLITITPIQVPDLTPVHNKGLTLHAVFMLIPLLHAVGRARHGEILAQVAQVVDAGKLRPLLDEHIFSFADVAAAHGYVESGQAVGKVTLVRENRP